MQIGWPAAKELLFTARVVEAQESLQLGLLNHLVDTDQLMSKSRELANLIASNDPRMVQGTKELMIGNIGDSWHNHYESELEALKTKLLPTPVLEGFKPFIERKGRKP